MKDCQPTQRTRKRARTRIATTRERPSWSSLLWILAAMASNNSWMVRGQSATESVSTATHTDSNTQKQEELHTKNVRGAGRAAMRHNRQHSKPDEALGNDDDLDDEHLHEYFLSWCQDYLAIDTSLVEIDHFEYPDYLKAMEDRIDIFCDDCNDDNDDDDDNDPIDFHGSESTTTNEEPTGDNSEPTTALPLLDDSDRYLSVDEEYPPISVRGLKATRDINVGEVVLSIPHSALWTVHNTIDASGDSNLVHSMGKQARTLHGWESPGIDDIPLLAVTLLYHMDHYHNHNHNDLSEELDYNRPQHGPYLDVLELLNLQDSIPHLWDSRKLRKSATPEVRKVAKGIRQDVVELYESIVQVLIQHHPDIFGNNYKGENGDSQTGEWMFSLEKFHWAFALVNSRHWHLQIPDDPFAQADESDNEDIAVEPTTNDGDSNEPPASPPEDDHETFTDQEGPPAATPTDEWVVIQDEKLREEEERELQQLDETNSDGDREEETEDYDYWPSGNSFLAPLADLLNFGPPCTRGIYNSETMAFEIIATCEFKTGQEITFWYTDACEDVFVANYGFTMPMMVPKCNDTPGIKDNRANSNSLDRHQQQQEHQQQQYLEDELFHAYQEMDRLDRRLVFLMNVLEDCHCGNQTELLAGAWKYPDEKAHEQNKSRQGNASSTATAETAAKLPPLPRTPSRPPRNSTKNSKKGPDAQHAIREGRTSKKDKTMEHSNQHSAHHHAMTRVRSRSHQGRILEF